jgi:hypothetical protein
MSGPLAGMGDALAFSPVGETRPLSVSLLIAFGNNERKVVLANHPRRLAIAESALSRRQCHRLEASIAIPARCVGMCVGRRRRWRTKCG